MVIDSSTIAWSILALKFWLRVWQFTTYCHASLSLISNFTRSDYTPSINLLSFSKFACNENTSFYKSVFSYHMVEFQGRRIWSWCSVASSHFSTIIIWFSNNTLISLAPSQTKQSSLRSRGSSHLVVAQNKLKSQKTLLKTLKTFMFFSSILG